MRAAHRWMRRCAALTVLATAGPVALADSPAPAAVFGGSGAVYKEYWVPHTTWTGGCPEHGLYKPSDAWYIEPGPCTKTVTFTIPDDVSRVGKVEMYLDLWRNYTGIRAARIQLNNGPVRQPPAGFDWSRSPVLMEIPVGELRQGVNTLTLSASPSGRRWHLHDVAFRVHHDATHPLIAGPGSDVTPPTVSLTSVQASNGTFLAAAGGVLQVGNDQLSLAADATGADRVEFHAFYDGYDTDNDGQFVDWQGFSRNNWNPGGATTKPPRPATGSTVGVPGIDVSAPYAVTWSLPEVVNQAGVRFKARAVDAAGNVRESAASAPFTLARPIATSKHLIPGFVDLPIHIDGMFPATASVTITLPSLAGVQKAYLVGHYWQNPLVQVNGAAAVPAFAEGQDVWQTSVLEIPVQQLKAGANTITYRYNPAQISYGQFVERPGPMIVLKGSATPPPPPPPPPGQRRLSVEAIPVRESHTDDGAVLVFKLTLDKPSTAPVTAVLATVPGGTATAPGDFWHRTPAVVSIPAGSQVGWFGVRVRGDRLREPHETVLVTVSGVVGATAAAPTVFGTIIDDD